MTGGEWNKYFQTLDKDYRDKLLKALETLDNDIMFKQNFGISFKELAYLIKHPLS